jgi:hypothetical protein
MKSRSKHQSRAVLLAGVLTIGVFTLLNRSSRAASTTPDEAASEGAMAGLTSEQPVIEQPVIEQPVVEQPHIDVVFAIDCSGSMGPVIETAKKKVWTIVNEIAKAKPTPVLRIGLIGYGDADRVFRTFALSDDLDTVYANLMTFRDEHWSEEYVGLAVHKAANEMGWSPTSATNLKIIYVLGNETARQGPAEFDYAKTAPLAWEKNNITVNAIYCNAHLGRQSSFNNNASISSTPKSASSLSSSKSAPQQQIATTASTRVAPSTRVATAFDGEMATWVEMAQLGKGKFLEIAGDGGALTIPTPYDNDMIRLNSSLNDTYLPYGRAGAFGKSNQIAQDRNSTSVGGAANMAARAQAKGGGLYNNRGWDLVDASRDQGFDWSQVKDEDVPEALKGKSPEERKQLVATAAHKRAAVQAEIGALGRKRDEYLIAEIKKQNLDNKNAFDEAVKQSIIEQAITKGFRFD